MTRRSTMFLTLLLLIAPGCGPPPESGSEPATGDPSGEVAVLMTLEARWSEMYGAGA